MTKPKYFINRSYYNYQDGIGYTMGRVPIGGADFSWRLYTYDDVEDDVTLSNFSLTTEDIAYKVLNYSLLPVV